MGNEIALLKPPANALEVLPDNDRYKCRFSIRSSSTNAVYRVSFDAAAGAGYWTCSCRGNIAHGQCKHLTAMGRRGRKFGRDVATIKALSAKGF
jgi:hypothetical protein